MRFLHASGQFSTSAMSVRASALELQDKFNPHFWSGTEMHDIHRAVQMSFPNRTFLADFVAQDGMAELFISVKKGMRILDYGVVEATTSEFHHENGARSGPRGFAYVLARAPWRRKRILYCTMHLANTKGNTKFGIGPRVDVFKEQVEFAVKFIEANGHNYTVVVGADFNTELSFPNEMRDYLNTQFAKVGLTRVTDPTKGIDGFYARGVKVTAQDTVKMNDSDHPKKFLKGRVR